MLGCKFRRRVGLAAENANNDVVRIRPPQSGRVLLYYYTLCKLHTVSAKMDAVCDQAVLLIDRLDSGRIFCTAGMDSTTACLLV